MKRDALKQVEAAARLLYLFPLDHDILQNGYQEEQVRSTVIRKATLQARYMVW